MTENRFLRLILTEGVLLLLMGLCMLILPKVSLISFGFMICLSFVLYGGFKLIISLLTKNFSKHFILDMMIGSILLFTGLFLFFAPAFDISWIIALGGVYFILKSISSLSFSVQTRKTLNFWWMCLFLAIFELFAGVVVIIMIQSAALWLTGVAAGFDFILSGIVMINMYISTRYIQGS